MSEDILEGVTVETKSTRGRKPGQKAKDRSIAMEDFVIEDVPVDERGFTRRQRGERTPQQKATDNLVLQVRKEWRDLGSPTNWVQMPIKRWPCSKSSVENALFMLRKAAALHGAKLIIGNISDKDPEGNVYPDRKWRIPFIVVDRKTPVTGAPESNESTYDQ